MPGIADDLIRGLRNAGTRTLFGLPGGGGNLDLIQAAARAGLPFVLMATETGSAIAAIAQSEITGAPGACITTLGPGAASVVNGIACARLERAPLLVITDSYASNAAAFEHQRLDHRALLASVVKWSGTLAPGPAGESLAGQSLMDAFDRLGELPPGPVHLDCPANFEDQQVGGGIGQSTRESSEPMFSDLLVSARKPLLVVGLAARRSEDAAAIRRLCETAGLPALVTYKAKGVVPDTHPWFGGVFTHGAIEKSLIDESDLIVGVGFDPVEILPRPWTYRQPVVSIAPWKMPAAHVPFEAQYVGDVAELVGRLGKRLMPGAWNRESVSAQARRMREAVSVTSDALTADAVIAQAAARFAGRARVTVDAGAHMFPATILWPSSEPNEMLISNGLSTMGFALPAAIGAAALDRERPIVSLTGDGGLLICMGELATVARERLPILTVVLNDSALSLIAIKQQARRLSPAGVALGSIDWARMASGFGIASWRAGTAEELDAALDAAGSLDGPGLIDARIDPAGYPGTLTRIRG